MNTADLITAFFNNEMSPDQERQFLLSVASSDSMRLGLKSHVMLDKLLQEQADLTTVPPTVRTTILREAAVVAAAAASGLAVSEAEAAMTDDAPATSPSAATPRPSLLARIPRWTAYPMSLLLAVGSFFIGFHTGDHEEGATNNALESTPLLDLDEGNATLPTADPLEEEDGSVVAGDEVVGEVAEPVVSTSGNNRVVQEPRTTAVRSGGRSAQVNPTSPITPDPTATTANSTSEEDSARARGQMIIDPVKVSKPNPTDPE